MSNRAIVLICIGVPAILVIVCAGVLALPLLMLPRLGSPARQSVPPELAQPAIVTGAGTLQKRVFLSDSSLGLVTDILFHESPEASIGIAGDRGAVWATTKGEASPSVSIESDPTYVDFVDVDGDGTFEFLNRGGHGWQESSLIDSNGNTLWMHPRQPAVDDMAAGDLDGDGITEFIVGHNGGGGVCLLDRNGKEKWQQPDSNVWHVEVVDTDGDNSPEIVHSNAGGQITVRDQTGRVLNRSQPAAYFSDFSLCHWPTNDDPIRLLVTDGGKVWLFDFDGKTVAKFDAPNSDEGETARGTPVSFKAGQPPELAVLVELDNWDRAILYVYDADGGIIYQEIIDQACAALAAIPGDEAGSEVLLVGGRGMVWEYRAPD